MEGRLIMKNLFLFILLCTSFSLSAQKITGTVYDSISLSPIEFVNVYDNKSSTGTITNEEGYFELELDSPVELRFSFLGYNPKVINLKTNDTTEKLQIYLSAESLLFDEVVLQAERSSIGKKIISKVIENKEKYKEPKAYTCDVYQQTTMTRFFKASEKDSIPNDSTAIVYLNELASTLSREGNNQKKIIKAEIKQSSDKQLKRYSPMNMSRDFKGSNQFVTYNPIEYFVNDEDYNISIYNNYFNNSSITDRPISSPLGPGNNINYKFRLKQMDFVGENDTIFTVSVEPRFKEAPLWDGTIKVHSNGFYLVSSDLHINPGINEIGDMNIIVYYKMIDSFLIATDKRIIYQSKIGSKTFDVKSTYRTSSYNTNPDFTSNYFNSETVRYTEDALEPNAELMLNYRGTAMERDLKVFFSEQDSIYRSITSDEYLNKQDSIFNKITWRKITMEGFGYRNRAKGWTFYWNGLLSSFQLFGVDGFRINPGGSINKEFINSNELDLSYNISYGIENNNFKGRGSVGYTFYPQKFARFFVGGGDVFDVVTLYQSLDAIISRSNFINNRFINAGYSMELFNGLYFNSQVEYSDKQSIANLSTNEFSEFLFGGQELALEFDRYKIFSLETDFIYQFGQKYVTRGRKKIVLPNNQPKIRLSYRKGIPGVADSEVNFDYLEAEWTHKLPSLKIGSLNYKIRGGSFLNQSSLRELEYNFFRGSTRWIFTNPLQDLIQIGKTQVTPNTFLQASGIHHFNGFFLDKVPLINKLQMELLAGAGTLIIPKNDLYHFEMYTGIGKKFKLFGETLQIACYAVTSDNNLSKAKIEYKFGLNFYNAFAREWLY